MKTFLKHSEKKWSEKPTEFNLPMLRELFSYCAIKLVAKMAKNIKI